MPSRRANFGTHRFTPRDDRVEGTGLAPSETWEQNQIGPTTPNSSTRQTARLNAGSAQLLDDAGNRHEQYHEAKQPSEQIDASCDLVDRPHGDGDIAQYRQRLQCPPADGRPAGQSSLPQRPTT